MAQSVYLEEISLLEKTCRTCCRYDPNDSMTLRSIFNGGDTGDPTSQFTRVFKEFELWSLEIKPNDGLPQQMCNDCLERFEQISLFREEVLDAQRNLSSYLKKGNGGEGSATVITYETFPMTAGGEGDRVGYISPSKLIEYVGSDEEERMEPEHSTSVAEIDGFEENESDFLFNHPNQIDANNRHQFTADDSSKPNELKANCSKSFEEKSTAKDSAKANEKFLRASEKFKKLKEKLKKAQKSRCDICCRNFRSAEQLQRHVQEFHTRNDFTCTICFTKFEQITMRNFGYHMKSHEDKKFKCAYCDKAFHQRIHLVNHERIHTNEKPHVCKYCGKQFCQKYSLNEHLMRHKDPKPFKCHICGKALSHRSGLQYHMRSHADPFQYHCKICGERFTTNGNLRIHLLNHTDEKPFQCKFCNSSFKYPYQLGNHMHTEHLNTSKRNASPLHKCTQCDKKFTNSVDLIQHQRMSHRSADCEFLCGECGEGFESQAHLNQHVSAKHSKAKSYFCIHCNKNFSNVTSLNVHLKSHDGTSEHKCSYCSKTFALRKSLQVHQLTHTKGKRFKCTFCDESFVFRQTLGNHVMNHFREGNEEEYSIKEDLLDDEDFARYEDDLDLNDDFKLDLGRLLADEDGECV